MAYRTTDEEFWTDKKFDENGDGDREFSVGLRFIAKCIFHYLFTNRHCHWCGMYYLPMSLVSEELELPAETTAAAMRWLEERGMMKYDKQRRVVWIRNMMKRQLAHSGGRPSVMESSLLKHARAFSDCSVFPLFIDACSTLSQRWRNVALTLAQRSVLDPAPAPLSSLPIADKDSNMQSARAKQIDINSVPPVKKAAKETKRKGAKKADPKKPDYIDQIIGVCSTVRFSYRRSAIHPINGKMRSHASEVLEFCKAQWGLLHSKHGWPEISSANILKYISLLYEAFMLEDETTGPDTDFARGCNFAFGAFRARIQKYAEMVANTNDSYGNPVFVPLDEPEDVLRYDPGCSHESLVRIEAFKQRRLKDGKLISRYVTASKPPHEKRWREEKERLKRGEPRSVTVEGDGNGER